MRICPACGRENDDGHDFCVCGEYLDWTTAERGAEAATEAGSGQDIGSSTSATQVSERPFREPARDETRAGGNGGTAPRAQWASAAPAVVLSVRRLQDERDSVLMPVELSVPAGGRSLLMALIRNQSAIVDNYDLSIEGLPEDWWTITPQTAYLVPFSHGAGHEQEIEIALHPPRSPQAEARHWPFMLVAVSRASKVRVATAHATIVIEPFWELDAFVQPVQAAGRIGAGFQAAVRNRGNAPVDALLKLKDDEDLLRFEPGAKVVTGAALRAALVPGPARFVKKLGIGRQLRRSLPHGQPGFPAPRGHGIGGSFLQQQEQAASRAARTRASQAGRRARTKVEGAFDAPEADQELSQTGRVLTLPPGEAAAIEFVARPQKQIVIGRATMRRFSIVAQTADEQVLAPVRHAALRQKPLLPWWLLLVVPLIVAAIVLFLLLAPKQVAVPRVIGERTLFAAQQRLEQDGLKLGPSPETRVDTHARPGSIIGQAPAPGKKVDKGSTVEVLVAVGTGKVLVPKVVGQQYSKAYTALTDAGLTVGVVSPKPVPGYLVTSELPHAGARVRRATPVQLFLAPPKKKKSSAAAPAAAAAAAGGAAGGSAGGQGGGGSADSGIKVPPLGGATLSGYEQKLTGLRLDSRPALAINAAKRATVIATDPAAGSKVEAGARVAVVASAGSPQLAYDDGAGLRAADGLSGRPIRQFAKRAKSGTEPTWNAGGTRLAYVSGGSIMSTVPQGGAVPSRVQPSSSSYTYSHPQFAPSHSLLAYERSGGGSDALCLSTLTAGGISDGGCTAAPGWRLGPLTWAADGRYLLVSARDVTGSAGFGLLEFKAARPFAALASNWRTTDKLVTPSSSGEGVLAAAISPDGRSLAVLSNLGSSDYRLLTTSAGDLRLKKARKLPLFGCALAWRSDSQELALVAGDPTCAQASGMIFGVRPDNPRQLTMLALQGQDPSWQPLSLSPSSVGG